MAAYNNLVGLIVVNLTVIAETDERRWREVLWLCECSLCGGRTKVTGCQIQRDHSKPWGCDCIWNIIGREFDRLTVIEATDERRWGQIVWLCKCSCPLGKTKKAVRADLEKGHVRSCGCLVVGPPKSTRLKKGDRFGRLVFDRVLDEWDKSGRTRLSLFHCDCGTDIKRRLAEITRDDGNGIRSCGGCGYLRHVITIPIGTEFDRLIFQGVDYERGPVGQIMGIFDCKCEQPGSQGIRRVLTAVVEHKRIHSCGCLRREQAVKNLAEINAGGANIWEKQADHVDFDRVLQKIEEDRRSLDPEIEEDET